MTPRSKTLARVGALTLLGVGWLIGTKWSWSPTVMGPGTKDIDSEDAASIDPPPTDHRERVEGGLAGPAYADSEDPGFPIDEILVVDVCGGIVPRAEVARGSGGARQVLGSTGSDGVLRLESEARDIDAWSVTLFGDAVPIAAVEHDSGIEGRVQLTVQFPDQLWGHVVRDDFGPDLGVRVCAWRKGVDAPLDAIREGTHPLLANVDGEGGFAFCGLDPGQDYFLVAAGEGRASELVEQATAGVADGIVVQTRTVYGAYVKSVEPDGRPARINTDLVAFGGFGCKQTGTYPHRMRPELPQPTLLGIPARELPWRPGDFLWIQCGASGPRGPEFTFNYPGYEATTEVVEVAPIQGGIQEHACILIPSVDGFGSLALHLTPEPTYSRGHPHQDLFAPLELELVPERTGGSIRVALGEESRSPWIVEGIPAGEYFARFRASHDHLRWPKTRGNPVTSVSITPDERSELRVAWPELGAVEVELTQGGEPYGGKATLSLVRPSGSGSEDFPGRQTWTGGVIPFRGPPYCFYFLPPGDYLVRVISPGVVGERHVEFTLPDSNFLEFEFELQ